MKKDTTQPAAAPAAAAPTPKKIHKLTVEIYDEAALSEAFPEVIKEVVERRPDREALYPLAKAYHGIGRQIPGVRAYYAGDEQPASDDAQAPADGQEGQEAA